MLDVLSMFSNQSSSKLSELLSKLGENLGANEVLDGCFRTGISIDIYVKLEKY